jgi:hypothetical protein
MLTKDVQEKVLNTTREQFVKKVIPKVVAKEAAQGGAKFLLKKLPLGLGLAATVPIAVASVASGDWEQAGYDLASGAAATVPGVGTAGSVAIDALAFKRTLDKLNNMSLEELQKLSDELDAEEASENAEMQAVLQHKPTDPVRFTPGKI